MQAGFEFSEIAAASEFVVTNANMAALLPDQAASLMNVAAEIRGSFWCTI